MFASKSNKKNNQQWQDELSDIEDIWAATELFAILTDDTFVSEYDVDSPLLQQQFSQIEQWYSSPDLIPLEWVKLFAEAAHPDTLGGFEIKPKIFEGLKVKEKNCHCKALRKELIELSKKACAGWHQEDLETFKRFALENRIIFAMWL